MNHLSPIALSSLHRGANRLLNSGFLTADQSPNVRNVEPLTKLHDLLAPAIVTGQDSPSDVGRRVAEQLDQHFSNLLLQRVQSARKKGLHLKDEWLKEFSVGQTPVAERTAAHLGLSLAVIFTTACHKETIGDPELPAWALRFQEQLQVTARSSQQTPGLLAVSYASETAEHFLRLQLGRAQKEFDFTDPSVKWPEEFLSQLGLFERVATYHCHTAAYWKRALVLANLVVESPTLLDDRYSRAQEQHARDRRRFIGFGFDEKRIARFKVDYAQEAIEIWNGVVRSGGNHGREVAKFPIDKFVRSLSPSDQKRLVYVFEARALRDQTLHYWNQEFIPNFRWAFKKVTGASLGKHFFKNQRGMDAERVPHEDTPLFRDCALRWACSDANAAGFKDFEDLKARLDPSFDLSTSKYRQERTIGPGGRELVVSKRGDLLPRKVDSVTILTQLPSSSYDGGMLAIGGADEDAQDVVAHRTSTSPQDQMPVIDTGGPGLEL